MARKVTRPYLQRRFQKLIREYIETNTRYTKQGAFTYHIQTRYGQMKVVLSGAISMEVYYVHLIQYDTNYLNEIRALNKRLGRVGKMGQTDFMVRRTDHPNKTPEYLANRVINTFIKPLL